MGQGIIGDRSYSFALRIIKLYKYLYNDKKEYTLSKQILRSGTAIGALCREAEHAQSKALKEANETEYWLMLLRDSEFITNCSFTSIHEDCSEIIKLLISIVRTTKTSLNK